MDKHTKTPWRESYVSDGRLTSIVGPDGEDIADRVAFANARLIVTAVNERSALLKVEEALRELRLTARVLLQNAEGCAANHYGSDFSEFGPPGWLADSENCIVNAEAALSLLDEARNGK